jgi:hypothetical protein
MGDIEHLALEIGNIAFGAGNRIEKREKNRANRVANRNPVLSSQSPFGAKFPDRYNTYKQGNFPIAPQNKPTIVTANGRGFIALKGFDTSGAGCVSLPAHNPPQTTRFSPKGINNHGIVMTG